MTFKKPKLFPQRKGFVYFVFLLLFFLFLRVAYLYVGYTDFIAKPFYYTSAKVLKSYTKHKHKRSYTVLKLQSDEGLCFYTTVYKVEDFSHFRLRVKLFPDAHISFASYLGVFYVKSSIKKKIPLHKGLKEKWIAQVNQQHESSMIQSLYQALFFAKPLDFEVRTAVSELGVSHLLALSGFHLGILSWMVYLLLGLLYRPLQQRYFPYRYEMLDVGFLVMLVLGSYVWFVDLPASLLRSYAMVLFAWLALLWGIELFSFVFLATVMLVLLVLFPFLAVNIGFWFSLAGVFYIFLLLHYLQRSHALMLSVVYIPVGVFVLMLPLVHLFFPVTTVYQLFSPLLSVLFIPFYPLTIFLHLLGYGDLFDSALEYLLIFDRGAEEVYLPKEAFMAYLGISLWAIVSKKAFVGLGVVSLLYAFYLFIFIE